MTATPALMTAEDLAVMPEHGLRHDLVEGELIAMSWPKPRHGRVAIRLIRMVSNYIIEHDLGEMFTESGLILAREPDVVRGPDFAFIAQERAPQESDLDEYTDGAPDLALEIVSPSNNAEDMRLMLDQYFGAGCRMVWVIYPAYKTLEVHRHNGTMTVLRANDTLEGEAVLPGLSIPVASLFA